MIHFNLESETFVNRKDECLECGRHDGALGSTVFYSLWLQGKREAFGVSQLCTTSKDKREIQKVIQSLRADLNRLERDLGVQTEEVSKEELPGAEGTDLPSRVTS
jgi:hypothetical protein